MISTNPDITIGVVNCNRLNYLRAVVDSILLTTKTSCIQLIVVDNHSTELGTVDYLDELAERGIEIHRTEARDPRNEYARALNYIYENAKADLILPMPGDVQFIEEGWVKRYKSIFQTHKEVIGCISIDAQRKIRLSRERMLREDENFFLALDRAPICGAGNCVFHKDILSEMYPWATENESHEGGNDSETKMLNKVADKLRLEGRYFILPSLPPAVAICNPDGSTAFVRGDKIYGVYGYGHYKGTMYYQIRSQSPRHLLNLQRPASIEEIATPYMWDAPLDRDGNWIKRANDYSLFKELPSDTSSRNLSPQE